MITVWVRFYEELNELLPPEKRKRRFAVAAPDGATVSEMIEDLRISPGQVDLALCNGSPVDLAHTLCDGDTVSVFPVFESFDISELSRVRQRPLRISRFIAAKPSILISYLRMLGFDAVVNESGSLVRQSEDDQRIILAPKPTEIRGASRVLALAARSARGQLIEVIERLQLRNSIRPLGQCPVCNEGLCGAGIPEASQIQCLSCGRVYRGAHLRRIGLLIDWALSAEGGSS